MKTTFE